MSKEIDQLQADKAKMREEYRQLDELYNKQSDRQLEIANKYWKRCEEICELKEAQAKHIEYVNELHEKIRELEGEIELLTRCGCGDKRCLVSGEIIKCQGCKNSEAVKKWRGEK